jgi:hypothetical protein
MSIHGDMCLADSATTHTILKDQKYFSYLMRKEANVNTISGTTQIIEGSGRAIISLYGGTQLYIDNALYSSKSNRNLLSFRDICLNGYHLETRNEGSIEYLCITRYELDKTCVLGKLPAFSSSLYYTYISKIEAHTIVNQKFTNHDKFEV